MSRNGNRVKHYSTKSLNIGRPNNKKSVYWRNKIREAIQFQNRKFVTPTDIKTKIKIKRERVFEQATKFKRVTTPSLARTAGKTAASKYKSKYGRSKTSPWAPNQPNKPTNESRTGSGGL